MAKHSRPRSKKKSNVLKLDSLEPKEKFTQKISAKERIRFGYAVMLVTLIALAAGYFVAGVVGVGTVWAVTGPMVGGVYDSFYPK